jgi:diguanylate cyclase (GGDEF)-like protein
MAGGGLVLREVSRRLVEELRAVDVVGRWGGEELIVVAGGRA